MLEAISDMNLHFKKMKMKIKQIDHDDTREDTYF